MDLVAGVETIFVITKHVTKTGEPKIVEKCTYPLTGPGVVSRIYTDLAVIDVTPEGLELLELAPGVTLEEVREKTATPLATPRASATSS
jgi:3-oxoacid CoA-transferase B subunit